MKHYYNIFISSFFPQTLYFRCTEHLDEYPDHAILKPNVTVQIGLDKNTKLSTVFERYVQFCGERCAAVDLADLEFVHSQVLSGSDTAEASALMKNDRISVRADRTRQRQADAAFQKLQKDCDKQYFAQLQGLGRANHARYCDTVLDCRGTVLDEAGRVQRVLSTTVKCHAAIVSKRCRWLGRFIEAERLHRQNLEPPVVEMQPQTAKESEDEDAIGVLNIDKVETRPSNDAAQIENDEEEDDPMDVEQAANASVQSVLNPGEEPSVVGDDSSLLRVTLEDYPPDAVRILLEYCYTNRVPQLGYDAFVQACKTKPNDRNGKGEAPCPPYPVTHPRRWPNRGKPVASFRTTLSALQLAEDASMPRLSLMCEVAAAQLVGTNNVVDAISICETQKQATGNELPVLRKAAMDVVLRSGARGVYALPTFRRALQDRSGYMVPTLLTGTAEAVQKGEKKKKSHKRDWKTIAFNFFDEMDYSDACAREYERHKYRVERLGSTVTEEEAKKLFVKPRRKEKRSLKRMSHHLRLGNRVVGSRRSRRSSRGV